MKRYIRRGQLKEWECRRVEVRGRLKAYKGVGANLFVHTDAFN